MDFREFKRKYFTNNFYWVNKDNYKLLQLISIKVGCICHNGEKTIIEHHESFTNLAFRTYEKNGGVTVFQKEPFLMHNEKATNFNEMLCDYEKLNQRI